jgi:hypothetical protein
MVKSAKNYEKLWLMANVGGDGGCRCGARDE